MKWLVCPRQDPDLVLSVFGVDKKMKGLSGKSFLKAAQRVVVLGSAVADSITNPVVKGLVADFLKSKPITRGKSEVETRFLVRVFVELGQVRLGLTSEGVREETGGQKQCALFCFIDENLFLSF